MKLAKKMASFLLAVTMCALLLAGCGTATPSSEGQKSTPPAKSSSAQPTGETIEIEYWHTMSGVNGEAMDKLAQQFNDTIGKEKGIVVNSVFQGNDNSEKLKTLAQADDFKNFPDAAQIAGAGIPPALEYDILVPIQSLLDKGGSTLTKEDLEPNMVEAYSYKGDMIGMPLSCSTILLYYNKDMFAEVGLDPMAPPATIAEMAQAIEKLKIMNGNEVERYGLNVAVRRYQLSNWIGGQKDGTYFGNNEGGRTGPMTKVTFGEDGTLRNFLEEWQKVIDTGGYKPMEDDINEEFSLELFGMAIMSTARIGKIRALVEDKFEWSVAPLPKVNAADKGGAGVGGSCVVVFDPKQDDARVQATWEFLQFLACAESQFQFHKETGYIPVNKGVYDLPGVDEWFDENPEYKVAIDQLHSSSPKAQEPFDMIIWEIDEVIKTNMLAFALNEITIDECETNIVDGCNEKLDEYYKVNG